MGLAVQHGSAGFQVDWKQETCLFLAEWSGGGNCAASIEHIMGLDIKWSEEDQDNPTELVQLAAWAIHGRFCGHLRLFFPVYELGLCRRCCFHLEVFETKWDVIMLDSWQMLSVFVCTSSIHCPFHLRHP